MNSSYRNLYDIFFLPFISNFGIRSTASSSKTIVFFVFSFINSSASFSKWPLENPPIITLELLGDDMHSILRRGDLIDNRDYNNDEWLAVALLWLARIQQRYIYYMIINS